ncbi:MAG: HD domain-containing protein [Maledivibacter sp.]|jgi:HD-GYP domain-containing protein (c-di-GMP phosphodiesterase class II)|nr:HD domain-containing protein [Maledivibacter sp.]
MRKFENFLLLKNLGEREKEHSKRVAFYSKKFGCVLGLENSELNRLYALALLHDIGKARIKKSILNKPGALNERERKAIETHSIFGEQYILLIPELKAYSNVVRYHHEKWDGKGYPDGLLENNIPFLSRIISITDVYDALTSERTYRKKVYTKKEALKIIVDGAGTQFDPRLTKLFIENINNVLDPYESMKEATCN